MTTEYVPYNLTSEQVAELWDGYAAGQTVSQLARRFDKRQADKVPAPLWHVATSMRKPARAARSLAGRGPDRRCG